MSDQELIVDLEKKLDAEYQACFPAGAGWEAVALHLLLVFDRMAADDAYAEQLDALKFPLMHALRWGKDTPSRPLDQRPASPDPTLLTQCQAAFARAAEYVGIWGAFTNYHRKLVGVSEVVPKRISFTANDEWQAFEMLSARLNERRLDDAGRSIAEDIGSLAESSIELAEEGGDVTLLSMANGDALQDLVRRTRAVTSTGYLLPDSWSFDGITISDLRRFWDSATLLAVFHLARTGRKEAPSDFSGLMMWQRMHWIESIGQCSLLNSTDVARLVDLLTYSRDRRTPDIALTPLLDIGGGWLVASPWMLFSSSMERNFCARLARDDSRYDQLTEPLHHEMAKQLTATFERAGFLSRSDVPITTDIGNTEIDLLVWSPSERVVIGAELKWVIAVADVMEVYNRGDAAARKAIDRQLPKYVRALSTGAADLIRRAFSLQDLPTIDGWHCGLILRGHAGSSATRAVGMFTLPESLVEEHVSRHRSLHAFGEWATTMPFLPKPNEDFFSERVVVRSPSGIEVAFFEPIPLTPVDTDSCR